MRFFVVFVAFAFFASSLARPEPNDIGSFVGGIVQKGQEFADNLFHPHKNEHQQQQQPSTLAPAITTSASTHSDRESFQDDLTYKHAQNNVYWIVREDQNREPKQYDRTYYAYDEE
ncbi:uncharacterized protein LOC143911930 [Arctopsyche grandis]|uniref:uncharacterized protein LOC143911930 n=1 Tax=Arctopsyche grandis TaxID=121162 RepID=UPI00406D8EEA